MVCQTQVNRNTGKSLYELVYGHKSAIVNTTAGPQLPLPKKVPDNSDPDIQCDRKGQEYKEKERVEREAIPLQQERFQVGDKIWVINKNIIRAQNALDN
ncbi:hypothetical protein DSO57_1008395 [Entomophthora muscae]|uniref:Uncharacterized protein n=1 Tax=Entomophthora muscae TaxID=34485 RepID=A0ACC2TV74_9FUNG|nr:hypothetical protein DSO57_1008395 [Entomophthora muscae]